MDRREQYHQSFFEALGRLNPSQRAAVEQIEGPVLVVAGPGTGKTQVLAARIGHILLETDTNASEILCLTFSDAGVVAMQDRLIGWLGPEAHRIPVFTFHAFANKVIRENPISFGGVNLEVIDEIERSAIIRRIMDNLPPAHPLVGQLANRYFYERRLVHLFKLMKQEDWSVEDMLTKIEEYVKALPHNPDFISKRGKTKGQLKKGKYDDEVRRMERLAAAVELFPEYVKALRQAGRIDFEDMIRLVVDAFQRRPFLLRRYQEKYLYFLVDEYQDTNGIQNQMLHQLISYWDEPNVFVVGDDDQSIFEFQGARIKNITDFFDRYRQNIKLFVLEDNYRSRQEILDHAGRLIQHNAIRLIHQPGITVSKNLTARRTDLPDLGPPVQALEVANAVEELAAIRQAVRDWQARGIPLTEMAIIYRRHKDANDIVRWLEADKINYELKRPVDLLQTPLAGHILLAANYIQKEAEGAPQADYLCFRLLHIPAFGIAPRDAIRLHDYRMRTATPWHQLIRNLPPGDELPLRNPGAISRLAELLDELIAAVGVTPLTEWFEKLINRGGFLAYALKQPDAPWQTEILFNLRHFVKEQILKTPGLTLSQLLPAIQGLRDNRMEIPIIKHSGVQDGIKLLTAHSAKGLEFHAVIMPGCSAKWEENNKSSRNFTLPPNITHSGTENQLEAERRLFYVAMTRARAKVLLLYPRHDAKNKEIKPSRFISEAGIAVTSKSFDEAEIHHIEHAILRDVPPLVPTEDELVSIFLERFTLSITALNQYLKCPVAFYYQQLLGIPSEPGAATQFGLAVHDALYWAVERIRLSKFKTSPAPEDVVNQFRRAMAHSRPFFSAPEYETYLARGEKDLPDYYAAYIQNKLTDSLAEYRISHTELDGIPIKAFIDRIDFEGADAHITDYKTGKPKSVFPRSSRSKWGQEYWRQLVFYAVAFQHQRADSRIVRTGSVDYIEKDHGGHFVRYEFEIKGEDKEFMRNLIHEVWAKIQNREFDEGCEKPSCPWCRFRRTMRAPDSFRDEELLGLDD